MTILLTGATGFIGRHVLSLLLERGDSVVTYGRSSPKVAGCHECRHRHLAGDIATGAGLEHVPWDDIDQVIHLAAAGVKASSRQWPEALAVNVVGTQRLLAALGASLKKPPVFIARTFYEKLVEAHPSLLENPYIATKHAATQVAQVFAETYESGVVFGTCFQVYGPGDDSGNVLSYAAQEFKAGRAPVFGSGQGLRDWIYISDAACAVLACMQMEYNRVEEYDLGNGHLVTIREMIETLARTLRVEALPVFDPSRDRPDVGISLTAAKPPPKWSAVVTLVEGLTQLSK